MGGKHGGETHMGTTSGVGEGGVPGDVVSPSPSATPLRIAQIDRALRCFCAGTALPGPQGPVDLAGVRVSRDVLHRQRARGDSAAAEQRRGPAARLASPPLADPPPQVPSSLDGRPGLEIPLVPGGLRLRLPPPPVPRVLGRPSCS